MDAPKQETGPEAAAAPAAAKEGKWYSFIVPSILGFAMVKLFGIVGAVVLFGVYLGTVKKFGTIGASVAGLVASVAVSLIIRAILAS